MKKLFSIVLLTACSIVLFAQSNAWELGVAPNERACEMKNGEIIVKFKGVGEVNIRRSVQGRFMTSSVSKVDQLLSNMGVIEVEDLMPFTGKQVSQRKIRMMNGSMLNPDTDLSKLTLVRYDTTIVETVEEAVEMLQELEEVEYAEPNYIVRIQSVEDSISYSAEPLYSEQWGLNAINIPWVWAQPIVKTKRPVIAIIDTGVDIEHPDLKDNIWSNSAETKGLGGQDDDGNGFFDDIHGYDFIYKTGVITDRNGHGTHCAGIAAAIGNNEIGIVGANPEALIMPLIVMNKSGVGTLAHMIQGVDYATANGADIISMSIGHGGYSQAEKEALLKAFYAGKYVVAAAGNAGNDIYPSIPDANPIFPAALKFVMAVEASDPTGELAGFSNYDSDGPIFSEYDPEGPVFFGDFYNYELRAPGVNILSTYPGGGYKYLNGTSMACPMVAGALSRLLMCRDYASQENLMGAFIQTRDSITGNVNMKDMFKIDESEILPSLIVTGYEIFDTIFGGNGDGKINPGETIEIYPTVQCIYGQANNISVSIHQGLNVDTTLLTFVERTAHLPYNLVAGAKVKSPTPIIITISEQCGNGYTTQLYPTIALDSIDQKTQTHNQWAHRLVLEVSNEEYFSGLITGHTVWYPDKEYIIEGNLAINSGDTLTIKPGTTIRMNGKFSYHDGTLIANGTPDSMIIFLPRDENSEVEIIGKGRWSPNFSPEFYIEYASFTNFKYLRLYHCALDNCNIANNNYVYAQGDVNIYNDYQKIYNQYKRSNFSNNKKFLISNSNTAFLNCNITNNIYDVVYSSAISYGNYNHCYHSNLINNRFLTYNEIGVEEEKYIVAHGGENASYETLPPNYYGTNDEEKILEGIWDIRKGKGFTQLDISQRLSAPSKDAHGIVWKVLINGYELTENYRETEIIGVGENEVAVYYNRAMDTAMAPTITMGVRQPYTQVKANDDGYWSSDSTIYYTVLNITEKNMNDGINQVLVSGGRDNDKFPTVDCGAERFQVLVQVAGSLSTGLMATTGIGKVILTWETDEEDYEDLLGYHILRWTDELDSTYVRFDEEGNWVGEWKYYIDTLVINPSLIDSRDSMYIDYDVIPGITYYYLIQQITTSLNAYNLSNSVAATPLTAQKGDANGSMSVDVADIVTEVAYLTGNNPQPFIFEAADVNADQVVNILDIVGTVNIITNPAVFSLGFSDNNTATYSIEDGILYVETPIVLGGVQFSFDTEAEISALEALNGFEQITWNSAETFHFMAYSMSGKTLGVGKHALLYVGDAEMKQIVLSNAQGQNVPAIRKTATDLSSVEAMQMRLPNPNPFTTQVNIPYIVGQSGKHEVRLVFTNVAGLTVDSYSATQTFGEYTYTWRPGALPEGVYFVTLYVDGKKIQSSKLVRVR